MKSPPSIEIKERNFEKSYAEMLEYTYNTYAVSLEAAIYFIWLDFRIWPRSSTNINNTRFSHHVWPR